MASKRCTWISRCWYIASSAAEAAAAGAAAEPVTPCSTCLAAMSSRSRCANASDDMPRAARTAGLTKPSGSRSWANCGIVLEQRPHPLVGRREMELVGGGGEHALADQGVERHAAHLRRLEHLGIDARHLPARPLDPLAQGVVELHLADLAAVDRGHRLPGRRRHAAVALDAEEHERREHQQHEHELQDAGMAAEEIEHGRADARKANLGSPFVGGQAPILAARRREPGPPSAGAIGGC